MSWIKCNTCDRMQNTDDGEEWSYLEYSNEYVCGECLDLGRNLPSAFVSRERIDQLFLNDTKGWSERSFYTSNPLSDLRPNIEAMFRAWYPTNMHIVYEFYNQSLYLKTHGKREHYSSQMIVHKLRWESALNSEFDQYKINQNIGSALGRIVMALDPRLEGMFRIQSHSAEKS